MRFRRKKGDEEEVVSGDVVPEQRGDPSSWTVPADAAVTEDVQEDTVDMEAVAPATAAGGASRTDDHGERTTDDSTTILQQATGQDDPDATVEHAAVADATGDDEHSLSRRERKAREKEREEAEAAAQREAEEAAALAEAEEAERLAGEEADRKAEEARLADEKAKREAEEARQAEEDARREAKEAEKAREEAEAAAKAQREADEKAREEAAAARAARAADEASTTVSGASLTSPGLGGEASPAAAAAANRAERSRPEGADDEGLPGAQPAEGPLAPILSNPAVQKKPELLVVGGLAAGFVVAKILKAITSPDA